MLSARAAQGDEDRVGVLGLVLGEQPVMAAGQAAELRVGRPRGSRRIGSLKLLRRATTPFMWCSWFCTGPEQDRVLQVHHLRHAPAPAARRARAGRAWGSRSCSSGAPRNSRRSSASGARYVRSEWVVSMPSWMFMPGIERQLVDLAQDDRLVGRLLGVLGHQHGPARVEGGVEVVVAAMDVEGVLGQGARADLEHHGRELARARGSTAPSHTRCPGRR